MTLLALSAGRRVCNTRLPVPKIFLPRFGRDEKAWAWLWLCKYDASDVPGTSATVTATVARASFWSRDLSIISVRTRKRTGPLRPAPL